MERNKKLFGSLCLFNVNVIHIKPNRYSHIIEHLAVEYSIYWWMLKVKWMAKLSHKLSCEPIIRIQLIIRQPKFCSVSAAHLFRITDESMCSKANKLVWNVTQLLCTHFLSHIRTYTYACSFDLRSLIYIISNDCHSPTFDSVLFQYTNTRNSSTMKLRAAVQNPGNPFGLPGIAEDRIFRHCIVFTISNFPSEEFTSYRW